MLVFRSLDLQNTWLYCSQMQSETSTQHARAPMSSRSSLGRLHLETSRLALGLVLLLLVGQFSQADEIKQGFEAQIKGAYEGRVFGTGVLKFLENAGYDKQGYYFLADGRGIRPHGVTFILPRGMATGRYELTSTSPFNIDAEPSVRVDRDTGNATISSERNTSGFIIVDSFPVDESKLCGSNVVGNFEFQTVDRDKQPIKVKGSFSFRVP
jgi:hypothetical protein